MLQSSPLINKNIKRQKSHEFLFTSMVSHRGTPVSFAMREDGRIFYSVLDMSNTEQQANSTDGNDKHHWSKVVFEGAGASILHFPREIMQIGYAVVPNFQIDQYDSNNKKVIHSYDEEGRPLDIDDQELSFQAIKDKTDPFYSSTARLGAKAPFQVLSDGKYIYVFRQSISKDDLKDKDSYIVDNTLLMDRFILSGSNLKPSREIRYQRSRHKTEPESRKDTLAAVDVEGNPFYEPTRELVFANHLANGNFSVLLIPGADSEEQRWQIFTADSVTNKINSFNIRFDYSIVFDLSDSAAFVDEFIQKYHLFEKTVSDSALVSLVQKEIEVGKTDDEIVSELLKAKSHDYDMANIPEDAFTELVYTIRTGVIKDDFIMESTSEWPLIEDGATPSTEQTFQEPKDGTFTLEEGEKIEDYTFLFPYSSPFTPKHGLSSCYYYQQELGPDRKPMKNKACVMLAIGLEDQSKNKNQYIGILNFAVAASGRLSRLTADVINLPDINVQALDENPYDSLDDIPTDDHERVAWQEPQKMKLLDIDPNGLSTTGGVLRFAYTSAEIGESQGYSDAAAATDPYLFDDSLGRVNLYFKGKNQNFFVLYFNPSGSKGMKVSPDEVSPDDPPLRLKPRLDRDMEIEVSVTAPKDSNTCEMHIKSSGGEVEVWEYLPKGLSQIANILNGNNELSLGTLEPLGKREDPLAAYLKTSEEKGILTIRTTVENALMFNNQDGFAKKLANGKTDYRPLKKLNELSDFLAKNPILKIAQKSFSLNGRVSFKADLFYKSYLSGLVDTPEDINKLWTYLTTQKNLISEIQETAEVNPVQVTYISERSSFLANDTTLTIASATDLGISTGDYLQIADEILRVRAINGNDLEVSRGQLGSMAVDHDSGISVSFHKCLINGALTVDATTLLITSAAALGIAEGDFIQIGTEILRVENISANRLTVSRGEKNTTASDHKNGSVVRLDSKGVRIIKGHLKLNALQKKKEDLLDITSDDLASLDLQILKEKNKGDKEVTQAILKQSLIALIQDVSKVRIVTCRVQDINEQSVDRLEAGLPVSVEYNYDNFTCIPANLTGTSASTWEHDRSYLFNVGVEYREAVLNDQGDVLEEAITSASEISEPFKYTYEINNTIGQWEDWEASLALEMKPVSAFEGATLSTTASDKLETLQPSEKGLSVEAWVKPSSDSNDTASILNYEKNDRSYSLGIERDPSDAGKYKCVASLGGNQYTSINAYPFDEWRHLAFAHQKYWGYQLNNGNTINCGNDSSLQFTDEFSIEVLVKIDSTGTLLEKKGEYSLIVNQNKEIEFLWGGTNCLDEWRDMKETPTQKQKKDKTNFRRKSGSNHKWEERSRPAALSTNPAQFYKITLIRSRNKPQMDPDKEEYPITGTSSGDLLLFHDAELRDVPEEVKTGKETVIIAKMKNKNILIRFFDSNGKKEQYEYEESHIDIRALLDYLDQHGNASWDKSNLSSVQKDQIKKDAKSITGYSPPRWYENENEHGLLQGMAEKQDQMDRNMEFSQSNLFEGTTDQPSEHNPKYFHTLIVTTNDKNATEWTSSSPIEIDSIEAYNDFTMGGNGFVGSFDSVRIWNRGLSIAEAKTLPLPENKAGLLSHWRMGEGKGNYLYDDISENHGVTKEGKWTDSPQSNQPGQFLLYVDGLPEAYNTPTKVFVEKVDQFCIGGKMGEESFLDHYTGTLEEIRIWNVPRSNEQITDNAFGRLKGEWEALLANYTFDKPIENDKLQDASANSVQLTVRNKKMLKEVLSTAPVATEIPQIRSALTGVLTDYNGYIRSRPGVVEYGDVQKNDDGTLNGILKRCYSFIDTEGTWNRMTGYKVGNLISQWFSQAQFAPQVIGYLEGPPPVPAENFPADEGTGALKFNSIKFNQAEEVSYNYSTSKEAGWNIATEGELAGGLANSILMAPMGFGLSVDIKTKAKAKSNWGTSGKRSQSYERGTGINTSRSFSAALAGQMGNDQSLQLGNTGYALVKSKTADIYLLRLAHNQALVSIIWQPNPDIPEDVNILPFPINPHYSKQGTLDGKRGETTDEHYPQAQGAYGQYSYFKPREAYKLKKQIEREKMELLAYFEDSFDEAKTNAHFDAATATTGAINSIMNYMLPGAGPALSAIFNQTLGQVATQVGYNNTDLKKDLAKMGSQRNLVNTYVWTIEGGFFAESIKVAHTQQETYANNTSLSLSGSLGWELEFEGGGGFKQTDLLSSGSSFTLTKSKTKKSSSSFGLDVSIRIPTSPRYQYAGIDGRTLTKGLIKPGTVDAYRFMSFYLEPKGKNFTDLFTKVIDPIWLDESPDPNAQALRQARGNIDKAKPCWRIMHRVTYVSRILPEFQPEAPPSLEKSLRVSGIESNYMLIKKFEPHVAHLSDSGKFFTEIDTIIDKQLPEFTLYKRQIKHYLALYFHIDQA